MGYTLDSEATDMLNGDAAAEGAIEPEVIPVAVTRAPAPVLPPYRQINIDRFYDLTGELAGLDVEPLHGHKVKQVKLRELLDGRWRVEIITEPVGGRPRKVKEQANGK